MAYAISSRRFLSALLILQAAVWPLRAEEPSEGPPQPPPPGSISEWFNPPPRPAGAGSEAAPQPLPLETTPPGPVPPAPPTPLVPVPTLSHTAPVASTEQTPPSPLEAPIWSGLKPGERERRKLKNTSETEWGLVKSEFVWQAPDRDNDSPFESGAWSTEDLFALPVTGPLYLFGEVSMEGQYATNQAMKVAGKSGVLLRLPVGEGTAIEVRGGPSMTYNDAYKIEKGKDQGTMLWEVKAKAPLLGPLGLEYLGEAHPGLTPDDHSQLNQDLNVFLPFNGGTGKLKVGAKHRWEPGQTQSAGSVSTLMQLYLGIEIGR